MLALAGLTAGCATIVNGGGQTIAVNTYPSGALCRFTRGGRELGVISSTPGSLAVDKSRKTLLVTCTKPGYQPIVASDPSAEDGTIYASLLFTGPFAVVDLMTAADYEYRSIINVVLGPTARPYLDAPPPAGF